MGCLESLFNTNAFLWSLLQFKKQMFYFPTLLRSFISRYFFWRRKTMHYIPFYLSFHNISDKSNYVLKPTVMSFNLNAHKMSLKWIWCMYLLVWYIWIFILTTMNHLMKSSCNSVILLNYVNCFFKSNLIRQF